MLFSLLPALSSEPCMVASIVRKSPGHGLAQGAPNECELLHTELRGHPRLDYSLTIFARRTCEHLKRLGIQHHDSAVFETNPVACRPGPQLLVDAFPGHADHFADFLLGDGDGAAARRELAPLGQPNQRTGEPARQILENDLFDLIAGPSQARAEQ